MEGLPTPSTLFSEKKGKIIEQLSVPNAEYTDASPKGSVDEGIRELIDEINDTSGFVTTSSCAGRVSVFLEGKRTVDEGDEDVQVAGVGGKGAGGTWLYVSHGPLTGDEHVYTDWANSLGLEKGDGSNAASDETKERRLIHFKFEAMILHVLTASPEHAQIILRCALQSGFRESGALNIAASQSTREPATPMVAVRSMGLAFESLIGHQINNVRQRLVTPEYLETLIHIANERFVENTKRIQRFRDALRDALSGPPPRRNPEGEEWEDASARRERKRAEGLRRRAEMQAKRVAEERKGALEEIENLGLD